ncbi:hypothetical protein CB1_002353001 [Camelus ferus]|nr:hypothetical protein CB1_002353001 [Camelus ferus]
MYMFSSKFGCFIKQDSPFFSFHYKVTASHGIWTQHDEPRLSGGKTEQPDAVNPNALKILDQISQRVVVVAIVGLYQLGKSYLMNRLVGQNHGFSLGSSMRSETKGIWMWCVPHPSKESCNLVLLDTEDLGDVENVKQKMYFALDSSLIF